MKKLIALIAILSGPVAHAQTANMTKVRIGSTFTSSEGNVLKLNSHKAQVIGSQCKTSYQIQDTKTGYITNGTAEYAAEKKDGGVLCTGGRWNAVGQNGMQFSGSNNTDMFIKGGIAYNVRR